MATLTKLRAMFESAKQRYEEDSTLEAYLAMRKLKRALDAKRKH